MRALLFAHFCLVLVAACDSGSAVSEPGLYLALGNSLSEGRGASDPRNTGFVPLVHEGLGEESELINLGHSGDTSRELMEHGHLDQAVAEIEKRQGDDDSHNDVRLITLEIGGNDLLDLFFELVLPGVCPALNQSLARPQCVQAQEKVLAEFRRNLETILDRLKEAGPDLTIAVMTLYDPFSGGLETISQLAEVALEGQGEEPLPQGLNDVIRDEVRERDLILVDWYPLFEGKANEYISGDLIHPNDIGHAVMANSTLEAVL